VYQKYPTIGDVLPAMGYGDVQMHELQDTINASNAELVLIGTPIDLGRLLELEKPSVRVRYELEVLSKPSLSELLEEIIGGKKAQVEA
jgi:predicted GTPase